MPDRVIVEVDQDLSDLIPGFLTHKRADIDTIFDAVTRRDYAEIGRIAHRVKGEGGSYGFDAMTEIGRSLENAAATRDDGAVTTLARQLLSYLDRLEIVFQPSKDYARRGGACAQRDRDASDRSRLHTSANPSPALLRAHSPSQSRLPALRSAQCGQRRDTGLGGRLRGGAGRSANVARQESDRAGVRGRHEGESGRCKQSCPTSANRSISKSSARCRDSSWCGSEPIVVRPSVDYFKSLARKQGTKADRAFFDIYSRTEPDGNGPFPAYIQQQTDETGCTRFDGKLMVDLYRGWMTLPNDVSRRLRLRGARRNRQPRIGTAVRHLHLRKRRQDRRRTASVRRSIPGSSQSRQKSKHQNRTDSQRQIELPLQLPRRLIFVSF